MTICFVNNLDSSLGLYSNQLLLMENQSYLSPNVDGGERDVFTNGIVTLSKERRAVKDYPVSSAFNSSDSVPLREMMDALNDYA